ncbi:hypothetical protein FACS1894186_1150 [Alphaproteobacteria bacterium]|nr:hypothetical protein FACS1894186_1150 [Alphaproteobacteria bacterium]
MAGRGSKSVKITGAEAAEDKGPAQEESSGAVKKPDPIDVYVGERIRQRRALVGISQGKLAQSLGITFQQMQKYEHGANRIGASRLWRVSRVMGVPINWFFDGVERYDSKDRSDLNLCEDGAEVLYDAAYERELRHLIRNFARIRNQKVSRQVIALVRALAGSDEEEPAAAAGKAKSDAASASGA